MDCEGPQGLQGIQGLTGPVGPQGDPATADGNGIYDGSGTTPSGTTVTITDVLNFDGDLAVSGEIRGLSDKRLKTNVAPILNAIYILNQLDPKTYNFDTVNFDELNLSTSKQYGLMAQELESILPELVGETYMGNDSYKSVNYQALIPILIAAIQEQDHALTKMQLNFKKQEIEIEKLKGIVSKLIKN